MGSIMCLYQTQMLIIISSPVSNMTFHSSKEEQLSVGHKKLYLRV